MTFSTPHSANVITGDNSRNHSRELVKFICRSLASKQNIRKSFPSLRQTSINKALDKQRNKAIVMKNVCFSFFQLSLYGPRRNKFILMLSIAHKKHLHKSHFKFRSKFLYNNKWERGMNTENCATVCGTISPKTVRKPRQSLDISHHFPKLGR